NYALKRFKEEKFESPFFSGSFFGEVSVKTKRSSKDISKRLVDFNILGGLPLGRFYEDLQQVSLFSFNELHSSSDIESLMTALNKIEGAK
ncbi:MAG TPA: hypothetical protein VNE86_02785, partial [Nitrososphaerales archaeon]|nr:hypothetical protein [Nitrososphaerales archaeon]